MNETLERMEQQFQHLREHISAEGDETTEAVAGALEGQELGPEQKRG